MNTIDRAEHCKQLAAQLSELADTYQEDTLLNEVLSDQDAAEFASYVEGIRAAACWLEGGQSIKVSYPVRLGSR